MKWDFNQSISSLINDNSIDTPLRALSGNNMPLFATIPTSWP